MLIDINLWYSALSSPIGVVIETDDPERAKQRLYALRAKSPDTDLLSLSIVTSPDKPNQLWIVKAKPNAPQGN